MPFRYYINRKSVRTTGAPLTHTPNTLPMRQILTLLFALLMPAALHAQNVHFKVGGGLATHYGSDSRCVGAFKIGVGYELELSQRWSFTPGLEFYGKGRKTPDETAQVYDLDGQPLYNDDGSPRTGVISRSATQNYLELPLLFSYFLRVGEARYAVFSAGPYLAYGLNGKQKIKGDTERPRGERYYYEEKTFDDPSTHRFDCGAQVYAGYQTASGFSVGIEADFGVLKFNTAGQRNLSALISLGYKL